MLTIAGNGMGDYNFNNLTINPKEFDRVICDKNFTEDGKNVLKLSYKEAKEYILKNYSTESILYVVTGSPLFYSAGVLIAKKLPKDRVKIINNTSSKSYLLERLLLSENSVGVLSLHGRDRLDLTQFLTKEYTFILSDKYTISKIKEAIKYIDRDKIETILGYRLGYGDEIIDKIDIFKPITFDQTKPFVLLIKRLFNSKPLSRDSDFKTERGMITKEYKRDLSLQNLDLEPNMILWDIGAGSGSCAIEAYKRYRVKTVLFEKKELRNGFIKENLSSHYVCDTQLLEGSAEELFDKLTQNPDRIFVGGGGVKVIARLPYLYERLNRDGVMLINAITLKNLTQMISVLNEVKIAYKVISLSLTTYKGALDLIEPERQLFQIKVLKIN